MEAWIHGRWLVDFVIVLTVFEGLGLAALYRLTGRGVAPHDYALNLLSGLCLMLALRSAIHQSGWPWVVACLTAAGVAHVADLWVRWRSSPG